MLRQRLASSLALKKNCLFDARQRKPQTHGTNCNLMMICSGSVTRRWHARARTERGRDGERETERERERERESGLGA